MTTFAYQHPTRCRACQSTKRTAYEDRSEEVCHTTLADGMPVTHIVRARTKCADCGQLRIDTTFHYSPTESPDRKAEESPALASELEFNPKTSALRSIAQAVEPVKPQPAKSKRGIGSKT